MLLLNYLEQTLFGGLWVVSPLGRGWVFTVSLVKGDFWLTKIDVLKYSGVDAKVLTKEEVRELTKQLGLSLRLLPWIRASDPLAKALGAKPGDVIKIVRKSQVAGKAVVYRVVVPG